MDANVKEILKTRKDHGDAYVGKPMSGDNICSPVTRNNNTTQAFTSEAADESPSAKMSQW